MVRAEAMVAMVTPAGTLSERRGRTGTGRKTCTRTPLSHKGARISRAGCDARDRRPSRESAFPEEAPVKLATHVLVIAGNAATAAQANQSIPLDSRHLTTKTLRLPTDF